MVEEERGEGEDRHMGRKAYVPSKVANMQTFFNLIPEKNKKKLAYSVQKKNPDHIPRNLFGTLDQSFPMPKLPYMYIIWPDYVSICYNYAVVISEARKGQKFACFQ